MQTLVEREIERQKVKHDVEIFGTGVMQVDNTGRETHIPYDQILFYSKEAPKFTPLMGKKL